MVDPEQTLSVWWSGWRQPSPAGLDRELEGLQRPFWITDGTRSAVDGWLSLSGTQDRMGVSGPVPRNLVFTVPPKWVFLYKMLSGEDRRHVPR